MTQSFNRIRRTTEDSFLASRPVKLTTEEIEQLKSVGYLNGAKKDQ